MFCRESVKLMNINKYGRIINISSIHVPLGIEGTSIYGASKAATEQFSKVLAREMFQYGITVNTISLSVVKDTGMESSLTNQTKQNILDQTISKSILSISDVIYAINFFISEKSTMVTNQILSIGGV